MNWQEECRDGLDSTWVHGGERRWPVRHNSGPGMERTRRGEWWYPHRPKRKRYPWVRRRVYYPSVIGQCWACYKGHKHPWWRCDVRSEWRLVEGWSPSTGGIKQGNNRAYRRTAKQYVHMGKWDLIPYRTVDWLW